jgi:putative copper resistance protein D
MKTFIGAVARAFAAAAFVCFTALAGGVSPASAGGQPPTPAPMNMSGMTPVPRATPPPGVSAAEFQQIEQIVSDTQHASPETSTQWSVFNHRAAGVFVFLWGFTAFIVGLMWPKQTWFRFAPPLVMLGLAEFLFIRNDPKAWPSGPIGFWISWEDPETAQHRIFVLLILAIVVVELLRAAGRLSPLWNKFALPGLVAITAVLLLFHQHGGFAMQQAMQQMATSAATPSPADQSMIASMTLIKHEHLVFALCGFGLGAARLGADMGLLKGRLGAALWPLFAVALGIYMIGWYTE